MASEAAPQQLFTQVFQLCCLCIFAIFATPLPRRYSPAMTRDQLAQRIAELSLLRGEFTLRSGRKSNYYLDK